MFAIVQIGAAKLEIVPENWIFTNNDGAKVMWPPKNITELQKNVDSKPIHDGPDKWLMGDVVVKRSGIISFKDAEKVLEIMVNIPSDNECKTPTRLSLMRKVSGSSTKSQKFDFVPRYILPEQILESPIETSGNVPEQTQTSPSASSTPTPSNIGIADTNKVGFFAIVITYYMPLIFVHF